MHKYIIMGVQGCGKGTQASMLARHLELVHISVGDIFRWHVQSHTKLGARIRRARDQAYAWVDRELDGSICGVAVPIRNADGSIAASINISLPAGAYTKASACQEYLVPLRRAAARIRSTFG